MHLVLHTTLAVDYIRYRYVSNFKIC